MTIASDVIYKLNKILTQTPMSFFPELEELKKNVEKKTLNCQINPEKEKQSCRNQTSWIQTILQRYNNQNSMIQHKKI